MLLDAVPVVEQPADEDLGKVARKVVHAHPEGAIVLVVEVDLGFHAGGPLGALVGPVAFPFCVCVRGRVRTLLFLRCLTYFFFARA